MESIGSERDARDGGDGLDGKGGGDGREEGLKKERHGGQNRMFLLVLL